MRIGDKEQSVYAETSLPASRLFLERLTWWQCYCRAFSSAVQWGGRATRKEFWGTAFFASVMVFGFVVIMEALEIEQPLTCDIASYFFVFCIVIPNLFAVLKMLIARGHDTGVSGQMTMLFFSAAMISGIDYLVDFQRWIGATFASVLSSLGDVAIVALPLLALSLDSQVGRNRYGLSHKYPTPGSRLELDKLSRWACFCRSFTSAVRWSGRATRKEFWSYHLFALAFFFVLREFPLGARVCWYDTQESWRLVVWVLGGIALYGSLRLHVARMHDAGWAINASPLSYPALLVKMLICGWVDSCPGKNEWGDSAKYPSSVQMEALPDSLPEEDLLVADDDGNSAGKEQGELSPLALAAMKGDVQLCEMLIDAGAVVNAPHMSPLHYAAQCGSLKACELLIECGADVNARNEQDDTPLDLAAKQGNTRVCRALIAFGASLGDKHGYTPLHWAAAEGHTDTCRLLISAGADLDARFSIQGDDGESEFASGFTPLEIAALGGYAETCRVLIAAGADIKGDFGCTPLHCAAMGGDAEVCRLLIVAGADVNARDNKDRGPMHLAAMRGNHEVCRLLRDAGADSMDMPDIPGVGEETRGDAPARFDMPEPDRL